MSSARCSSFILKIPPETIDHILSFLIAAHDEPPPAAGSRGTKPVPQYHPHRNLKSASLISTLWRGPSQRRLFAQVVVRSSSEASHAAKLFQTSGLGECVRRLRVQAQYVELLSPVPTGTSWGDAPVTADEFATLLRLLPRVQELQLGCATFSKLPEFSTILPNVQTLRITTAPHDTAHALLRSLLRLTPNLETLELSYGAAHAVLSFRTKPFPRAPPLPSLRTLALGPNVGAIATHLATLLRPETCRQITTVHLVDGSDHRGLGGILELLPNVERVVYDIKADAALVRTVQNCFPLLAV